MKGLVVLVLVLGAGPSSVAPPQQTVTIQFRLRFTVQQAFSGSLTGKFQATGAISASGAVAENYVLSLPRLRGEQPVETVDGLSTLVVRGGAIKVSYTGIVSSAAPSMTVTEGRWSISGATGRFHGLRGRGRFSAVVDLGKRTMVKRYDGLASG